MIEGDAIFLLFLVCLADLHIHVLLVVFFFFSIIIIENNYC